MRIEYKDGLLTATAENIEDIGTLMALKPSAIRYPKTNDVPKRKYTKSQKPRKRNYKKPCEICGKKCRGLIGLATHKRLKHSH